MSFQELPIQLPELRKLHADLGTERIRRVVREFYDRMAADTMIGFFFSGRDLDAIAAKQTEFLLRAMGAIPSYSGKPPAQAHDALPPILPGFFDRRLKLLEKLLQDSGLSEDQIRTWIGFENAFRDVIVKPGHGR